MAEGYETFELLWQERRIAVSFQSNWLQSAHCHIELRSKDRLPVTDTGYRSQFVAVLSSATAAEIETYVTHWLDEAAMSRAWQEYLEDSRQLSLF